MVKSVTLLPSNSSVLTVIDDVNTSELVSVEISDAIFDYDKKGQAVSKRVIKDYFSSAITDGDVDELHVYLNLSHEKVELIFSSIMWLDGVWKEALSEVTPDILEVGSNAKQVLKLYAPDGNDTEYICMFSLMSKSATHTTDGESRVEWSHGAGK